MKSYKSLLLTALLTICSLIIAGLAAELLSRMLFPEWAPRTGRLAEFWQYDPVYGWAHKPSYQGRFESYGFDVAVRTNSHGFRGPERSFEKRPGERRAIVLGDSFVWGFGVEEKDSFPEKLGALVGDGIELVNLGVSGYSTDQELLVYRNVGRKYSPDLVILVVATNDVAMNVSSMAYLVYGKPVFYRADNQLHLANQPVAETPWLQRFIVGMATRSYVLNSLNRIREQRHVDEALDSGSSQDPVPNRPFPKTEAELVTFALIDTMRKEVEQDGARFLVVLVDGIYAGTRFRDYLTEQGINVAYLDEFLEQSDSSTHLPDELHWNAAGHEIVARALAGPVRLLMEAGSPAAATGETKN